MDLGLKYQGRAGILLGNSPDFCPFLLCDCRAGGIIIPLNPLLKGDEIKFVLQDAE
jgi:acyl-CoA synthetase (AMP-forming)/AMP-acid ligase II